MFDANLATFPLCELGNVGRRWGHGENIPTRRIWLRDVRTAVVSVAIWHPVSVSFFRGFTGHPRVSLNDGPHHRVALRTPRVARKYDPVHVEPHSEKSRE